MSIKICIPFAQYTAKNLNFVGLGGQKQWKYDDDGPDWRAFDHGAVLVHGQFLINFFGLFKLCNISPIFDLKW